MLHFTMDLNISLSSAVSGNRNGITSRTALRIPLLDGIRLSCHGGLYLSPNIKSKFKISIYYNKRKPGKMQSLSWLSVSVSPGGPRDRFIRCPIIPFLHNIHPKLSPMPLDFPRLQHVRHFLQRSAPHFLYSAKNNTPTSCSHGPSLHR